MKMNRRPNVRMYGKGRLIGVVGQVGPVLYGWRVTHTQSGSVLAQGNAFSEDVAWHCATTAAIEELARPEAIES